MKPNETNIIPSLTLSFGSLSCSQTDLESLQRIIRTKMTEVCMCHKNSISERFFLLKNDGGLRITDIHNLHNGKSNNQVLPQQEKYFPPMLITHFLTYLTLYQNK